MALERVCDVLEYENGMPVDHIGEYVEFRGDAVCGCTTQNVYEDYCEFCKEHDYDCMKGSCFKVRLSRNHGFTTIVRKINGKSVRVVVKKS